MVRNDQMSSGAAQQGRSLGVDGVQSGQLVGTAEELVSPPRRRDPAHHHMRLSDPAVPGTQQLLGMDRVLDQVSRKSKQSKADVHVIAGPDGGAEELLGAGLPEWCAGLPLGGEALDPVADAALLLGTGERG